MPGIAGIISIDGQVPDASALAAMVGCMMHESGYRSGTYVDDRFGVALGWVAQANAFSDAGPVWNEAHNVGLLFNGEDFRDQSEIAGLREKGHRFVPHTADYLPHLYEEDEKGFLLRLNGCFSGIILDARTETVVLFNDRFGLNRLYYYETERAIYFASEAKSLLKIFPHLRKIDPQGLSEFFSCGSALQNRCLFSGISPLPGASAWTITGRQALRKNRYFDTADWGRQPSLSVEEYYLKMEETFTRVLPRYFAGPRPIAISLTGGLDSRMIVAGAAASPGSLPSYTFGGMYRQCEDVKIARKIAELTKQNHTIIPVDRSFFGEFPSLAAKSVYYTDGAMDVTGAVELFCNRFAREIAPVRMTGNYGSEILRGNVVFKSSSLDASLFEPSFTPLLSQAAKTFSAERQMERTAFIVNRQVPWYHYARLAIEQSQLTVRSPFLDNELVAVAYQAPIDLLINKDLANRYIAHCDPALAKIPNDRGVVWRPNRSVGKVSRFCEEFLPRVEYVFDYGMPPWLARLNRFAQPTHLEKLFLGRQKFYHFRPWYRDELAPFVKDILLDPRTLGRPYLNGRAVEKMVAAHTTGRENRTLEIHKLLSSELLQRQLIETV